MLSSSLAEGVSEDLGSDLMIQRVEAEVRSYLRLTAAFGPLQEFRDGSLDIVAIVAMPDLRPNRDVGAEPKERHLVSPVPRQPKGMLSRHPELTPYPPLQPCI